MSFTKNFLFLLIPIVLISGCGSLMPSNYIGRSSVQTPQKINGQWVKPRLITVTPQMLTTPAGRKLIAPALKPCPYRIGAYDNLNVIVWGHPDVSTIGTNSVFASQSVGAQNISLPSTANPVILVETDGTIFYPYVGRIKVAGLTTAQLECVLASHLSKYIRHPQVTVQIAKYRNRNVYVLGEVSKPGMQPLTDRPLSLMESISTAGGIQPDSADPSHIYLVRGDFRKPDVFYFNLKSPQALMIAEKFPLQENDMVLVSAAALAGWTRLVNEILPSLQSYFIIKEIA